MIQRLPAYILAGGRSTRFGSDKARAPMYGQPLIVRQAQQLQSLGHEVFIVGRYAGQYEDLGLMTIGDLEPGSGPVGGLLTALTHRGKGWLILTCCDLLNLQAQWLDALQAKARDRPNLDAVARCSDRWEPFPGLYHTRLMRMRARWRTFSFQHVLALANTGRQDCVSGSNPVQANTAVELRSFTHRRRA